MVFLCAFKHSFIPIWPLTVTTLVNLYLIYYHGALKWK